MGFLGTVFSILVNILFVALLGRVIMSWIDPQGGTFLSRLFFELTEPLLAPIRRFTPQIGMFDISPIIAFLLLQLLRNMIVYL